MTTQTDLPLSLRIPSKLGKRPIQLSSLRPGDWLAYNGVGQRQLVLQNSAILQRMETRFEHEKCSHSYPYSFFARDTYLGQGRKRAWWALLPKWAKKIVSPYSKP